jgi:hypothetical protein
MYQMRLQIGSPSHSPSEPPPLRTDPLAAGPRKCLFDEFNPYLILVLTWHASADLDRLTSETSFQLRRLSRHSPCSQGMPCPEVEFLDWVRIEHPSGRRN